MSLPKPVRVGQPTRTNGCSCCRVLASHGCSNTITKNGNKIWYVLHNLVEMMPDRPTEEDCANMRTTIHTILQSMPCTQCKLHFMIRVLFSAVLFFEGFAASSFMFI